MAKKHLAELLRFEPPSDENEQNWNHAEKEALKFPGRFREKCRLLTKCSQELRLAREEHDRLYGFVVRNLISMVDNCKAALPAGAGEAGVTPEQAAIRGTSTAEPSVASKSDRPVPLNTEKVRSEATAVSLGSVHRSAMHLLEEMGVVRVDLVGHTYEDVFVDGQKIEDPFEVIESQQKGKASEIKVTEVLCDLWVRRRKGEVRILSRGKVCC